MWFKNIIVYRITGEFNYDEAQLEEKLQDQAFTPCGSQDLSRYGWVSPSNGLQDTLLHSVHGFHMIAAQKEEKILPPAVVKQQVEEKVSVIEKEQARKVYRKERDQLKDEVVMDLLPRAFSRFQQTCALIAPQQGWVIVDASSHKRAEELLSYLRGTLGTLPVALPDVKHSPSAIMSHWLEGQEARPQGLEILDEAELRDNLVEGGVIRIKGQELLDDEFVAHLEAGKRVVKLSVEWEEQLRFMIQEDLAIKRIKLTDQMKEKMDQESPEDQLAQFDTDMAQMGIEFTRLFPMLIEGFGGLAETP
ncbi:recombination-associated protein RdgC [Pontibacterium sp. N1Y112]|uniref:Recombination-associated protein RdgC n=1 Tax=Pontibacterium sinense TaxID=2781979 RepID=A0A8J7FUL2_9GAMM|nr:recombination-associated protein RdgC [Pontibacterium sinense]MBE9399687.1 recombination-associated protein RdgC [Pontibacterium sinense]